MQVTLETKDGLQRELTVEIPATEIEQKIASRLQELSRTVRLDGFRPGKVPVTVVKQRYGQSIRGEVLGDLIRESLPAALEQEKVTPAGYPEIHPKPDEDGKNFVYTAKFEVFPEIDLKKLNGTSVEKLTAAITDNDLAEMLDKIRQQHGHWHDVERAAAHGDQVVIDFEGFIDNEPFAGGKASDFPLELGSKSMIPGFEEGLVGAIKGKDLDINVTFPAEYHGKDLAGKPAVFKITVKAVKEKHLPELNEEFAKKFDIKDGNMDILRAEIRESMLREMNQKLDAINKKAVFDAWLKNNTVQVPAALVDNEIHHMQQELVNRITGGRQMDSKHLPDFPRNMFEEEASRRVVLGLLMRDYIAKHELKAEPKRVQQTLETLAKAYEHPQDVIAWYHANKERMAEIEAKVLEDQVVEALLAEAKVNEVTKSYQDVMNHRSAEEN